MDSVLSGASKKVLEMARKKDKFIEDKGGGSGKMFSAAKLVAKAIYDGLQMQIGDDGGAGSNSMLPGKRSSVWLQSNIQWVPGTHILIYKGRLIEFSKKN